MIKRLVKHGHSRALVIDKSLLQAAGLDDNASFQLIVNPNGGLLVQSVDDGDSTKFEKQVEELSEELFDLMKSLSKK
jgi:antitoxin component of MazEF toxin-antitoxin module